MGVALNSAPTEGVPVVPLSQIKATFPVLKNPANRNKAIRYDFEQWNYAFTNTCPEEYARRLYERYAVPVSGHILFESALANLTPGHGGTYVGPRSRRRSGGRLPTSATRCVGWSRGWPLSCRNGTGPSGRRPDRLRPEDGRPATR